LCDIHCQDYIWVSEKLSLFGAEIIIAKFQMLLTGRGGSRNEEAPCMYDSLEVPFSVAQLAKRRIRLFI